MLGQVTHLDSDATAIATLRFDVEAVGSHFTSAIVEDEL